MFLRWPLLPDTEKVFSITTDAGAKIQPYFTVPLPTDPNIYHFVVQGEECGDGPIRVGLTQVTAGLLREAIGDLQPMTIADAVERAALEQRHEAVSAGRCGVLAVEVLVPNAAYTRLRELFSGVSDEHNFKQLLVVLRVH